ncbi:hypothetical protein BJY52DRAFT_1246902, partial [Lactarius psammicola]
RGCIRCAIRRLSAILPHTHPPPLALPPRRVLLVTRSRPPPNGLRPPRTHPRRFPYGLRQPRTHPRLPFAQSGGGRCAQGGHPERGAVQPERRTARGCTASAVSSHARKGWRTRGRGRTGKGGAQPRERPHANGEVCARGWCSPAFLQRREDMRAGYDATRARAARETEGGGHSLRTLAPSKST